MTKPFEFHGVKAEKAEAMRRYNNRKSLRNIIRAAAVASLSYLWFPTVAISLQAAGDWFYRTGAVIVTNRSVVFVFVNLLGALIFILSRDHDDDIDTTSVGTGPDLYEQYTSSSAVTLIVTASGDKVEVGDSNGERCIVSTEPDEYDQHTSSSAVIVTASDEKVEDDDSNKQIVSAFMAEADGEAVTADLKGIYRRTKSEKKKEIMRPAKEFRRTESAKSAIERLSSEEFRLKVEAFIMEKRKNLAQENVVQVQVQGLLLGAGSC